MKYTHCLKKIVISICVLINIGLGCALPTFINQIVDFNKNNIVEKTYLQTDRDIYLSGEQIWFNALIIEALLKQPVDFSKVVYIDIVNAKGQPVIQNKWLLENGKTSGKINLPLTIQSGLYNIVAYTRWQRNFVNNNCFIKSIQIVNPYLGYEIRDTSFTDTKNTLSMNFFPEGGNIVLNEKNRIAFKLFDKFNNPYSCKGTILDENDNFIDSIYSNIKGVGECYLTPQPNTKYKAKVITSDSVVAIFNLPEIENDNVTLIKTSNYNNEVSFKLLGNTNNKIFYYVVQNAGVTYLADSILSNSFLVKAIAGLNTVYLYNNNGTCISSRSFLINPFQKLKLNIEGNKKEYKNREKVNITVTSNIKLSNLTVAVRPVNSFYTSDYNSIIGGFYMNNHLKNYFDTLKFNNTDSKEIDFLLLFNNQQPISGLMLQSSDNNNTAWMPDVYGYTLSGTIKCADKPADNMLIMAAPVGVNSNVLTAVTNNNGKYYMATNKIFNSKDFIIKTLDEKSTCNISIDDDKIIKYPFHDWVSGNKDQLRTDLIKRMMVNSQIADSYKDIVISYKKLNARNEINQFNMADEQYLLKDYVKLPDLDEFFREVVKGVVVSKSGDNTIIQVVDKFQNRVIGSSALFLVDGIPYTDTREILKIEISLIKNVELYKRKIYIGKTSFDGLISLHTVKDDFDNLKTNKNALRMDMNFINDRYIPVFPQYANSEQKNSLIPDFRNTLFWNSNVQLNTQREANIEFFTSDDANDYEIYVEGIATDGSSIYLSETFKVN